MDCLQTVGRETCETRERANGTFSWNEPRYLSHNFSSYKRRNLLIYFKSVISVYFIEYVPKSFLQECHFASVVLDRTYHVLPCCIRKWLIGHWWRNVPL